MMTERKPMDCEEALSRLAEYLDGELSKGPMRKVEEHLERCRSCFSRGEFERRLRERLRTELRAEASPELEGRIRRLIANLPEAS